MLQPVRTKWRKAHKGRIHGNASRANFINYGAYALKAMSPDRVTGKQIEAARVALTRHMKRQGRVWTRVFPNIPVSKKPIEVRMGKGKGSPEYYACRVKPGRILFEVDGVSEQIAKEALYKASAKLPIKTKTIKRLCIMKKQEIKKLSKDEILKNIDKLKKDLFNFRFQKINSQITNPAKIGETKKTIARLKTTLKEKLNA
jgi:large subunit ribosomal protein L16